MKQYLILFSSLMTFISSEGQNLMTPEKLIELGKVSGKGLTRDGKSVLYSVKTYSLAEGKAHTLHFSLPLDGGVPVEIHNMDEQLVNDRVSPDGKHRIGDAEVKVKKITGSDFYPSLTKSDVLIYDDLNYRHWDTWEDGYFSHVFLYGIKEKQKADSTDIMAGEAFDCPQKPHGGNEDYVWSPDSKHIVYVTKKKYGKEYALSTNTDLYSYDLETGKTVNLTQGMDGYDTKPSYSAKGKLAWLSMKTEGNESDKNDLVVMEGNKAVNLTKDWDGTVNDFRWSTDGSKIYFTAPVDGTVQAFEVSYAGNSQASAIRQISKGDFDIHNIIAQAGERLVVERTDMNHAAEIFTLDTRSGEMKALTHVNDKIYDALKLPKFEKRFVTTTDGQKMLVWVIFPPDFSASRKYPALLYCQGGPQSALTQFYSFRWNFQLMASSGYVVIAPNRRGMPGHGVKWNAAISGDYGGQSMKDYLSASDEISKEPYIDKARVGCVGASYGGYSVYFLAGMHEKRFKTFIAHDGIFDWRSMYGTTEEMWFVNHDLGGPYWDKGNAVAQKSYGEFNPVNFVKKWDTPILIIQGGRDYRVPVEQGLGAFQAAQLQGIKSKLLYFPNENHWIMQEHDALVWQHEFYKWLSETL